MNSSEGISTGGSQLSVKLGKLDHIAVVVESIEESSKYYSGLLGFQIQGTISSEETGDTYCAMTKDDIVLELVEVSKKSPLLAAGPVRKGMSHLAYLVDDIEAALKGLRAAGAQILAEKSIVFGKTKFNYAKMRNDLILEVMQIPKGHQHAYQAL
jgi:catechol 2,3-dioxygenase-like lactoylglutathione lyase family enzyme